MVEIDEDEIKWAYNLWNSMMIGGTWELPGMGLYRRTGDAQLTLIEIHQSVPETSSSLFEQHQYIALLANEMGWEMVEAIERAYDKDSEPLNIPEGKIGRVAACFKRVWFCNPYRAVRSRHNLCQDKRRSVSSVWGGWIRPFVE